MRPPNSEHAACQIAERLAELLGVPIQKVKLRELSDNGSADWSAITPDHEFYIEYKSSASAGPLAGAVDRLRQLRKTATKHIPLLVVPYMGQVGMDLCAKSGISWFDLSGNARITGPGLRTWIEGRPNRYVGRGRPPNLFAPKSSRVTRQLLRFPDAYQTQVEIARATGLGDGYVSRIVRRLRQEQYVEVNEADGVRPRDADVLLDAWRDAYDFHQHRVLRGHVPARSGEELLHGTADCLSQMKIPFVATGLGAAWLISRFASFRLTTFFLEAIPTDAQLEQLNFTQGSKGANLWLVLPFDEAVFEGSTSRDGVPCASPLQVYLDLKAHPERAAEASDQLRTQWLEMGKNP